MQADPSTVNVQTDANLPKAPRDSIDTAMNTGTITMIEAQPPEALYVDSRQESSQEIDSGVNHSRDENNRDEVHKVRFGKILQSDDFEPKKATFRKGSIPQSNLKNKNNSNTTLSVFERLSKTDTVASIHRKLVSRELKHKRSTSAPPLRINVKPKNDFKPKQKVEKSNKIVPKASFDRLAESHTKLSKIRQRKPGTEGKSQNLDRKSGIQRPVLGRVRSTSRGRASRLERWKSETFMLTAIAHFDNDEIFDTADGMDQSIVSGVSYGPPMEIEFSSRMQVFTTNTRRPQDGYKELDCAKLALNGCLAEYEAGGLSPKEVAYEIVSTLFLRDLPEDLEWSMTKPLHRELALPLGEKGFSFFIEAKQQVDKEDQPTTSATATANVIFIHDLWEIHVENYSFNHDEED